MSSYYATGLCAHHNLPGLVVIQPAIMYVALSVIASVSTVTCTQYSRTVESLLQAYTGYKYWIMLKIVTPCIIVKHI